MICDLVGFDERKDSNHSKLVCAVGKNKTVLDIGCNAGHIAKRLKENGCSVVGVEIDKEAGKKACNVCNGVIFGNVEELVFDFEKESFDVILFGDVLEHLLNPLEVLIKLKTFLKKDGVVVASLPNVANWKIRLNLLIGKFDYAEVGIMDKTHLIFFTRKNARKLIEDAGFEIVKEDFTPSFPFPFFKRQFAKIRPEAFASQFIITAKKEVKKE